MNSTASEYDKIKNKKHEELGNTAQAMKSHQRVLASE